MILKINRIIYLPARFIKHTRSLQAKQSVA